MSAVVVRLPGRVRAADSEALKAAVVELHTLVSLDRTSGAAPVRIYFAFNPAARARIAACLDPTEPACRLAPSAYALVAYDFPFALHLLEIAGAQVSHDRAKEIVALSAGLQGDMLQAAAEAVNIEARPCLAFDAAAVKAAFFPKTQETLTHLYGLEIAGSAHPPFHTLSRTEPGR
jgi:hypothetical protein